MANDPNVERLLLRIITVLVDKSNQVNVTSANANGGTTFQATVAASDAGKVIGKGGRTARALRILLSAMGVAAKTRYGLNIVTTADLTFGTFVKGSPRPCQSTVPS
jgi:predicted RNA-binding protein YlqC (UPF0109 family)